MNFATLGLDLQSVVKRTYANLYYKSTAMNFLDQSYMQVARATGTPVIEVIKQLDTPLNKRSTSEITAPLTSTLATYDSVMVNLTELSMDYSFRISPVMIGTNIMNTLEGQINKKDSQIAKEIDTYVYGKFDTTITGAVDGSEAYTEGQQFVWAPANNDAYIPLLNKLTAFLFNRDVYDGYMLGLKATEYANFVSALTSIIKFETRTGVEGIDKGKFAAAYGVDTFQINDGVITTSNTVGFFGNQIAAVGDLFFSSFAQYPGNYPGYPGYFVMEGNVMFGAELIRPEALIKLVKVAA